MSCGANGVGEVAQDRPGGVMVVGSIPDSLLLQVPNFTLENVAVVCVVPRYLDDHVCGIFDNGSCWAAQILLFRAEVVGFVFSPLTERVDHALLVPEASAGSAALPGWNVVGPLHSA